MEPIAALILDLRTQAGLSQSEIARRTRIPQPRISRWQAGGAPDAAKDALRLQELHRQLVRPAAANTSTEDARDAA